MRHGWFAVIAAILIAESAAACTLCGGSFANRSSLRQEALQAKYVYYGTMSNPRITIGNAAGAANASATDFTVDQVVKSSSAARKAQKQITIPHYLPVDGKTPPKYLVYCGENDGKLDPYRCAPVSSPALVEYIRGATAIDTKDTAKVLAFAGKHLDHADADVAFEAFLELAKADDADVLAAAKVMDPKKIRKLIDDPRTPSERLGLYAYLLGACGTPAEAEWIKGLLRQPGDRFRGATSGLYAGLIVKAGGRGSVATLKWWVGDAIANPDRRSLGDFTRRDFLSLFYVVCALFNVVAVALVWHVAVTIGSAIVTTWQWIAWGGPDVYADADGVTDPAPEAAA